MTIPKTTLSKLIGSMGPSDSYFEARSQTSAKDAQQRWPMFKTVAPTAGELTPGLTALDKQRWQHPDQTEPESRKVNLSRSGHGEELAKGLNKISRQTRSEARLSVRKSDAAEELSHRVIPVLVRADRSAATVSTRRTQDMPVPAATRVASASEDVPLVPQSRLFSKKSDKAFAATSANASVQPPPVSDDSLDGVFNRLQGVATKSTPSKPPRASFLGRLGKR